jgi:hypothetical protein
MEEQVEGRLLRMPREPKQRDRLKWDGIVVLDCHGSLGGGRGLMEGIVCGVKESICSKTLGRESTSSGEEVNDLNTHQILQV